MSQPGDDPDARRWNHNIHYHPVILGAIPTGAQRALDVGCGEGGLTRALRQRVPEIVGIDLDEPSIELARQRPEPGITYVVGDVFTHDLEPESFDVVASVAMLHHVDAARALERMAELTRPGGVVTAIGLARTSMPKDLPRELAAAIGTRLHKRTKTYWEHSAPMVWPPPHTYDEMRAIAERTMPGVTYRRHLLWRYSLVWTKPA